MLESFFIRWPISTEILLFKVNYLAHLDFHMFHMDDFVGQFSVIMSQEVCRVHSELKHISLSLGSCAPAMFEGSH